MRAMAVQVCTPPQPLTKQVVTLATGDAERPPNAPSVSVGVSLHRNAS
jgi:hypothetical protein